MKIKMKKKLFLKLKRIKIQNSALTCVFLWVSMFLMSGQMNVFANDELSVPVTMQARTVQGIVTDDFGDPLPGVNITIKGTTIGVMTGIDGSYTINVPDENAVLVFSYIGFIRQETVVRNQTVINMTMKEDIQYIEEVVVIGYGTVRKSDLTGSVSSIKTAELVAIPKSTVLQALQGRTSGVHVKQNSGAPGGATTVRIRGTNSIQGGNDPLYVIDGFPSYTSDPTVLDVADIESIEILKDASAIAIYGSRGSNGVIMITTKKGKEGQTKVDFGTTLGYQ